MEFAAAAIDPLAIGLLGLEFAAAATPATAANQGLGRMLVVASGLGVLAYDNGKPARGRWCCCWQQARQDAAGSSP